MKVSSIAFGKPMIKMDNGTRQLYDCCVQNTGVKWLALSAMLSPVSLLAVQIP